MFLLCKWVSQMFPSSYHNSIVLQSGFQSAAGSVTVVENSMDQQILLTAPSGNETDRSEVDASAQESSLVPLLRLLTPGNPNLILPQTPALSHGPNLSNTFLAFPTKDIETLAKTIRSWID